MPLVLAQDRIGWVKAVGSLSRQSTDTWLVASRVIGVCTDLVRRQGHQGGDQVGSDCAGQRTRGDTWVPGEEDGWKMDCGLRSPDVHY